MDTIFWALWWQGWQPCKIHNILVIWRKEKDEVKWIEQHFQMFSTFFLEKNTTQILGEVIQVDGISCFKSAGKTTNETSQPPISCPVQPCIPASMGDEICGQKGFADVQLDGAVYIFMEVYCFDIIIFLPRKRSTCKIWTLEIWSCFTLQADFPLRYEKFKGSTVGELWAAVKSAATGIDPTVRESRRLRMATVDWKPMAHRGDRGNDVVWRDVVIAVEQEDKVSLVTISGRKKNW